MTPAERARLTLDAIETVENIASGEWTLDDARQLLNGELDAGLVQYIHFLEATLTLRGSSVEEVRRAARLTCAGIVERHSA